MVAPEFGAEIPTPGLASWLAPLRPIDFEIGPSQLAVEAPPVSRLGGLADRLPLEPDQRIIFDTAKRKGVDPLALAAIRMQENGGPGREYGVLSVPAPRHEDQADIAANSLLASEGRYRDTYGISPKDGAGRYTPEFWRFFGARWAPIDAANDPQGLNRYWVGNVTAFYQGSRFLA